MATKNSPPIFNKINIQKDKTAVEKRLDGSVRLVEVPYTIVYDDTLLFKLTNEPKEVLYNIIYEILYTDKNKLPYNRDTGVGIDDYTWDLDNPDTREQLISEIKDAFSNNDYLTITSIKISIGEYQYTLHLNVKFDNKTFSIEIPLKSNSNPVQQQRL